MDYTYSAFISYRHLPLDKRTAERVEKAIERYRVPRELREKAGGAGLMRMFCTVRQGSFLHSQSVRSQAVSFCW